MAELFDPSRHTPLKPLSWDAGVVAAAIQEIVADAETSFDPAGGWPAHPLDDGLADGTTSFYWGSGGVLWAMDHLRRDGAATHGLDIPSLLPALLERNRTEFAAEAPASFIEARRPSYLFGDVPFLLMMIRAAPGGSAADALFRRIEDNLDLPVLELMWGFAGAMLACLFAYDLTGEDRWRGLYAAQATKLLADLSDSGDGPTWTQHLYGHTTRYLGPVHGYAGNMLPLLRGWGWLTDDQKTRVRSAIPATLWALAQRDGDEINWPPMASSQPQPVLVQHCHGAPGMATALANGDFATVRLTGLLRGAGELTWRAGPLAKGSNLCHGTGGNGFAFLKLHQLTGDALWLERARAFAMHAIDQCAAARAEHGRGRYSLWTGDIGLACYLLECLRGSARFPTIDVF